MCALRSRYVHRDIYENKDEKKNRREYLKVNHDRLLPWDICRLEIRVHCKKCLEEIDLYII